MDSRAPRDGRVIEELGTYDPMVPETDARAILKGERIDYWLSVGAKPTPKVGVLIKKYGTDGTHLEKQQLAIDPRRVIANHHHTAFPGPVLKSHNANPVDRAEYDVGENLKCLLTPGPGGTDGKQNCPMPDGDFHDVGRR